MPFAHPDRSLRGIILLTAAAGSLACGQSGAGGSPASGGQGVSAAGSGSAGASGASGGTRADPGAGGAAGLTHGGTSAGEGATVDAGAGGESTTGGTGACPAPSPAVTRDDLTTFPPDEAVAPSGHKYFRIVVKNAGDGTPLRGAHLRTVNQIELVSDDNGVVAFYEPGLMGRDVYFSVTHPGYEMAADGFGNRGKALTATEGGSAEMLLTKTSGTLPAAGGDLASRLAAGSAPERSTCFAVRVYDDETKRGVPLVKISAFGESTWTDSQGVVAYCNPDHLPSPAAEFQVWSHGYALANGATSVMLDAAAGKRAEVPIHRSNLAERLYRLTGGGIHRESVILGLKTPLLNPTLDASVLGQDTSSSTVYHGKLFWLWQDTNRVSYPLGNFRSTGATSPLPTEPRDRGVDLTYIQNADGFTAEMCPDCMGGPAWLDGLFSTRDTAGQERLFGGYTIVAGDFTAIEAGMVRFNDASQHFERVVTDFTTRQNFDRPSSHPFAWRHGTQSYAYYQNRLRIPARAESFIDPAKYEYFTPYAAGVAAPKLTADGTPDYAWRAAGLSATSDRLAASGFGAEQSLDGHLAKASDGGALELVGQSTTYHPYGAHFLLAGQQKFGATSALGEIWQAEADTPMGPWLYAVQLISHDNYTFYNVIYHQEMARGPFAYLEGTYTASFSSAKELTPRYDYNQLLYRIDLSRPELSLPVAVYDLAPDHAALGTKRELRPGATALAAAFLAFDQPATGAVPVAASDASCRATRRLELGAAPKTAPLFYAFPPDTKNHTGLVPLYEWTHADGRHAYAIDGAAAPAGFTRAATPLALVFKNPVSVKLPVADYLSDLIADAGADQCLSATGAAVSVKLDASASTSQGNITRYLWHVPGLAGCEYLEGAQVSVQLSPGIHAIELEVTDDTGLTSHDTVTVSVE